jgi:hypothetical protein
MREHGQYAVQWSRFRAFRAGRNVYLTRKWLILWWSQQDSNLRPLACEPKSNRDYSLNLPTKPNHLKACQSTSLVVLARCLHQHTDNRRYSDRVRLHNRPTSEGMGVLHGKQEACSKHLEDKLYFSTVRLLSESIRARISVGNASNTTSKRLSPSPPPRGHALPWAYIMVPRCTSPEYKKPE